MERFLIKAGPRPSDSEACWEWQACCFDVGYGCFVSSEGKAEGAHRSSYRLFVAPLTKGTHVLHKCDNRKCVNPTHLFVGTNTDNMKDRDAKGRGCAPGDPRHPQTKLSREKAWMIRRRRACGESYKSLAASFGVHFETIGKVCRNEGWI